MPNAITHLDVAPSFHTEHFGEVTFASAVESVQHLSHEGVSFVVVGARYDAVVDVRYHKDDSVTIHHPRQGPQGGGERGVY
jgi:hypothetical protein